MALFEGFLFCVAYILFTLTLLVRTKKEVRHQNGASGQVYGILRGGEFGSAKGH